MYVFADSIEVCDAFRSFSDYNVYVVEIELTDFSRSMRPDAALGIAVALDKASHCSDGPVIVVAERNYEDLEGWSRLALMKNVVICLKPLSASNVEEAVRQALSSG
jgi:hypothetical protein